MEEVDGILYSEKDNNRDWDGSTQDKGVASSSLLAPKNQPYTCPICGGNGLVQNEFYNQTGGCWSTATLSLETCRTCNGRGIVWG